MWKVSNSTNDIELKRFEKDVIDPLWIALKAACHKGTTIEKVVEPSQKALLATLALRRDRKDLATVCNEFIRDSPQNIITSWRVYTEQNEIVRKGKRPAETSVDRHLTTIFCKYLYEEGFNDAKVWHEIRGKAFSREEFHNNFCLENSTIPCCPYCDLDTINSVANRSIEHFLPKSKYPYLALNALNMVPSCHACNSSWEGKGTKVLEAAFSPFDKQIGDDIRFLFDAISKRIIISSLTSNPGTDAYIELLGLYSRYAHHRVYDAVITAGATLYETFVSAHYDDAEAVRYIKSTRTCAPLQFAMCAYVREYSTYQDKISAPVI